MQPAYNQTLLVPGINTFEGTFFNFRLTEPGADITTTSLLFDKKGFLWSGTYTGLYRFDGQEYMSFPTGTTDAGGLAGNQVTDSYEDSDGTLWIATFGALNRLDHVNWTFRHYFPDSLNLTDPANRILSVNEDTYGYLWLITGEDIYRFNKITGKFRQFPVDSSGYRKEDRISGRQNSFLSDTSGRIWITSADGLYMYSPVNDSFRVFRHIRSEVASLPDNNVTGILQDHEGAIWISCATGGLCQAVDPENGIFRRIVPGSSPAMEKGPGAINLLISDSKGKIWTFGEGSFACFDPKTGSVKSYSVPEAKELLPDCRFDRISFNFAFEDRKGDIWFLHALEGFMFRLQPESEKLTLFFVPNWSIFHAIMDKSGSFWFGCGDGNCWRLVTTPLPYRSLPVNNAFEVNALHRSRISRDHNGNLWFALTSGIHKAVISETGEFRLQRWSFPDGNSDATCTWCDSGGNMWFGRKKGILTKMSVSQDSFKSYTLPEGHTGPIDDIIEDSHGNIWFISPYSIFQLPKGGNSILLFSFRDKALKEISAVGLYNVIPDSSDRLWFASFGNRIFSFRISDGQVNSYGAENGLDIPFGDYCLRIAEDENGRIWFLFYTKGLYFLDPATMKFSKVETVESEEGRTNFFSMFHDRSEIRIGHSHGITMLNTNSLECRHYKMNLRPGGSAFFRLSQSEVLFLSGRLLYKLDDRPVANAEIPPVYITGILVNNQPYSRIHQTGTETESIREIKLNHRQNTLLISYAALNYLYPSENRYRYIMKGVDKDTIETTSEIRRSEYKDMKPGRYAFWVTGSNNDGFWNAAGAKVDIVITPPWYRSVMALILYLTCFTVTVILLFNWRVRNLKREKVFLEKEVSKRTAELESKNRRIEEMDSLKTRFFSEISHEIRTPLTLITGPVECLISESEGKADEKSLGRMEMIRRNAMRLHKLVDQLLDISKIDAGMMKLTLEESDIFRFLRIHVYGFLSLAEQRKIHFEIRIPDESFVTFFDRDKIEKIVSNLLANAFKFTPSGGRVTCQIRKTSPAIPQQPENIEITVSDTGKGISREMVGRIFDRFYSSEGEWEKDGRGTGIGLSLARELAGLLHGTISVESAAGKGSVFTVTIPAGRNHLNADEYRLSGSLREDIEEASINSRTETAEAKAESEVNDKKQHVLIAEDNEELRTFLRDSLEKEYNVIDSGSGRSALEIAILKIPDLIITDIMMPDMDGWEICRKLKTDERTSHIPVIMLTARTSPDDKITGLEAGADDYINKPFNIRELNARISNLLVQREKLRLKFGLLTGFESKGSGRESVDEKFMRRLTGIIHENINDFEFDVGALQVKMGLSRIHLYRKLKALTGLTPHELILKHRMKEAARLISLRSGNLAEIAMSVGFSNPSYFSKCFREYYGMAPKDFIKKGKVQSRE